MGDVTGEFYTPVLLFFYALINDKIFIHRLLKTLKEFNHQLYVELRYVHEKTSYYR